MRQDQILIVADAEFAEAVAVGDFGDRIHLIRGQVARRAAFGFQRQGDNGVARNLVRRDRIVEPVAKRPAIELPCANSAGASSNVS